MISLAQHLDHTLSPEASYEDLAELCKRVFCTLEGLPKEVMEKDLDKEEIAINFAILAKAREVDERPLSASAHGARMHNAHDKGHWLEVMASILKMGASYDRDYTEKLLGN